MEITKILQGLKGKVLDLRNFELLKSAYGLQEENLKQLKTSNETLKASNESLHHQIRELQARVAQLTDEKNRPGDRAESTSHDPGQLDENDCISLIETWMRSRTIQQNRQAINYADVDSDLKLPPGSAEHYIEQAAQRLGYVAVRKGATTIMFDLTEQTSSWVDARRGTLRRG